MSKSVVILELLRASESVARTTAIFDELFSISSNQRAFVMKSAFGNALNSIVRPADLRGLFCV